MSNFRIEALIRLFRRDFMCTWNSHFKAVYFHGQIWWWGPLKKYLWSWFQNVNCHLNSAFLIFCFVMSLSPKSFSMMFLQASSLNHLLWYFCSFDAWRKHPWICWMIDIGNGLMLVKFWISMDEIIISSNSKLDQHQSIEACKRAGVLGSGAH